MGGESDGAAMRGTSVAVACALLVSFAAGCAGSQPAGLHEHSARCAARVLALRAGARVVPMTGEHAVLYAVRNRGPRACTVRGYAQITLFDASGRALPFRYADGGGTYVTSRQPATVLLAPGAAAYLVVAKYRCDLGIERNAAAIRVTLLAARGQTFTTRQALRVAGPPGLSYCRGGPHDPGQLVTVSPAESDARLVTPP
jgi:Domain of unknown function (DUF4232)